MTRRSVALFVVLPLVAAVLFLVYRARRFIRNMLVVSLLAVAVWGLLKIAAQDYGLFDRTKAEMPLYQPASCFVADGSGVKAPQGCLL